MSSAAPAIDIEASLLRQNVSLAETLRALQGAERVDLTGLPPGAAAMLLCRAALADDRPRLIVARDAEQASRLRDDLAFFLGDKPQVLLLPPLDTSPYADVAPDRRIVMDRLAVLSHLAQGLPWRFLVAAGPALVRRVPPPETIRTRSQTIRAESELDREKCLEQLVDAGYVRVPVAEDPGTFAVRGALLDVFPPQARHPVRIELDDWLVLSIKRFDADDQRSLEEISEVHLPPARDAILRAEERSVVSDRLRALCDAVDWPSSKTRRLLDDLEQGRPVFGIEGLLPAFHEQLVSLFDCLPPALSVVVVDAAATQRSIAAELKRARQDYEAKVAAREPAYGVEAHCVEEEELVTASAAGPLAVLHALAVQGEAAEVEGISPLARWQATGSQLLHLGGDDQQPLRAALRQARAVPDQHDALAPLAQQTRSWLEAGLHVLFAARTHAQAERLVALLRGYEVPVDGRVVEMSAMQQSDLPSARARVVVGRLAHGFVLPAAALACVTEEEIFGVRAHKRHTPRKSRNRAQPFLEDLRELAVGDYVVHVDHGIGRYLGLEYKELAQSQSDRLLGKAAPRIEVLVVEYAGGKLLLPVTRLHQVQKYASQEGQAPRLDKLGGQSFAKTKARAKQAVKQLADELLKLYAQRAAAARPPLAAYDRMYAEFEATFPFEETPDQARAIDEVMHDLMAPRPMDRLVCGDVGFGKTEVAIRAAFRVAANGRQVAVLCPTTVLAQQHHATFQERLRDHPLRVAVLSRFLDRKEQGEVLLGLKQGTVDIVIGTHRLLSRDIHFKELGLLVVDEEQRFGVTHKERIKQLRSHIDVLTLSATPIPRTLHMAIGGLRDLSLITTAPIDRRAVRTVICRWDERLLREAIERELSRGGQVFFVYNRIEGLYERAARLQEMLPQVRFAVAHGQMKEGALEQTMTDFVEGKHDVLCATAIIESGLDISRANTILIDRADTFGLSQLYQLRGRVGRSRERAYCYLITPPPNSMTDEARARVEAIERFAALGSGFHIASLDMELRGAGDLLGAEQSGTVMAIGLELFVTMLEEAMAESRGEPLRREVDTELTLDLEQYLPDDYVEDVGLRLSFYKRFAAAESEQAVLELGEELEDRFGPPPDPARQLIRAMSLKPRLRELAVLGCEANASRVTLHLREDTPLDPAKVLARIAKERGRWKLTADRKLTIRFDEQAQGDVIDRVAATLGTLQMMRQLPT